MNAKENNGIFPAQKPTTSALPALASKKWLAVHFGICGRSGAATSRTLYNLVLTPDVLTAAGLDVDQVRSRSKRFFTATETTALYRALNLL